MREARFKIWRGDATGGAFEEYRTDVGAGMVGTESDIEDMDAEKLAAKIKQYPGLIVGIKCAHYGRRDWYNLEQAVKAGNMAGVPMIVDNSILTNDARASVKNELSAHFRPEFLNRIDDVVLFTPLRLEQIKEIVGLLVDQLRARLDERRIDLVLTDGACAHIAETAYDPVYGARPLKRFIQHEVETRVGRAIIAGDVEEGSRVVVDVDGDGGLIVKTETPEPASA